MTQTLNRCAVRGCPWRGPWPPDGMCPEHHAEHAHDQLVAGLMQRNPIPTDEPDLFDAVAADQRHVQRRRDVGPSA